MRKPPENSHRERGLKRTLGLGGLFSIGYADIGAGIYLALGLVALHAGFATPLAIGAAAVAYILTGLTYAELGSTYPMAGGSATFAREAFGDAPSFVAGWMLCLDYIVTAAIFSIPAVAYLSYFAPVLKQSLWLGLGAISLLVGLVALNIIGIRESARFTLTLSLLAIASQIALISLGLILVVIPSGALFRWPSTFSLGISPSWPEFVQGITLAMVSYLGIEAVAQAAEETKIAGRTLPRATMLTVATVVPVYLLVSFVAVNIIPPGILSTTWKEDPLSGVASGLPLPGSFMVAWIAVLGTIISVIGANAGIIGSSRMLYALSNYRLFPRRFGSTHGKFRTPYIAVATFGGASILLVMLAAFNLLGESVDPLLLLGSLYNVGALFAYIQAHLSIIVTRNSDPSRFRPFRIPLAFQARIGGRDFELPILPLIGLIVTGAVWIAVLATHEIGRLLGLFWVLIGLGLYAVFRRRNNLPIIGKTEV